jgi:hypothetical protein
MHLLSSDKHHFLVVNRSLLKKQLESIVCAHKYDIVVVDEAHQLQSFSGMNRMDPWSGAVPILFVTASPKESCLDLYDVLYSMKEVSIKKARYTTDDVSFCVEKTQRAMNALGVAKPKMIVLKSPLKDHNEYYYSVVDTIIEDCSEFDFSNDSKLRVLIALSKLLPNSAPIAARAALSLLRDKIRSEDIRKEVSILLSAHGLEFPSGILTSRKNYRRMNVCKCCDLTPAECDVLHAAHAIATPNVSPPPWTLIRNNFTSALIRFRDRKDMEETIANYPIPESILVFKLTSDKSAAYRARLVKRFATHDGQQAKLTIIKRAVQSPHLCSKGLYTVAQLGMGKLLLSHIESCLARPRLLLADATVDVGFDLHRHVDGLYISRVPQTYVELCQISGRISRIAVDREDQGTFDVYTHCIQDTLDDALFLKHIGVES